MKELSLFSGIGGGLLGSYLLGWHPVAAVDFEPYCCEVLARRKADGIFKDPFDIYCMDIGEFNRRVAYLYRGKVDIITAGFPCQPFSQAGKKQGESDERNGWPPLIETIRLVRPRYLLLENVPALLNFEYFGTILRELSESGYDVVWKVISAAEVGAPHKRDRLWIVGKSTNEGTIGGQRLKGNDTSKGVEGGNLAAGSGNDNGNKNEMENTHSDRTQRDEPKHRQRRGIVETSKELADSSSKRCGETGGFCGEHPDGIAQRSKVLADSEITHEWGLSQREETEYPRFTQPGKDVSDTTSSRCKNGGKFYKSGSETGPRIGRDNKIGWWDIDPANLPRESESYVGRVVDGLPNRVDRVKAIGNGQIPRVVQVVWNLLSEVIK